MAQFKATIKGTRGEASRLGSKVSGMSAKVNGWYSGINVEARSTMVGDTFYLWSTGGSADEGTCCIFGKGPTRCGWKGPIDRHRTHRRNSVNRSVRGVQFTPCALDD